MRSILSFLMLSATLSAPLWAQDTGADVTAADAVVDEDQAAIRTAIESYVTAFNQGDATAVAAHWTADGEFIPPTGEQLRGTVELEKSFREYFAEQQGAKLELESPRIVFLSPSVAIETGIARVVVPEGEPAETDYKAVHVKSESGWKIDSVREYELPAASEASHYEKLKDLEWMIGKWTDADDNTTIETTCSWTTNRNFITRSFKVFADNRVDFAGTQVIGWDPHAETIRSWMFDSDGGFAVGRWTGDGDRWTVKTLHVMPDGRRASATNIYERLDADHLQFRSIGRQAGNELLPNIGPVTVARASGS
jgi:uncharacterized protein (TIGR02246 family)